MVTRDTAFAGQLSPGERPALLLVDPVNAYIDPQSPLYLETGAAAVEGMEQLLAIFRKRNLPIAFTGVRYLPDGSDGGHFFAKVPALTAFVGDNPLGNFPASLQPAAGEEVFIKQYPSAFFNTTLKKWLKQRQIDTLFLCGFSTSGCVRASTLDALQNGFIPFVVKNACADRTSSQQNANLNDLQSKYAEIIDTQQCVEILDRGRG